MTRRLQVFLKQWSQSNATNQAPWLGSYGAIACLCAIAAFLAFLTYTQRTMPHASRKIHAKMLTAVLSEAPSYFFTMPAARLINRFGSDMNIVDFVCDRHGYVLSSAHWCIIRLSLSPSWISHLLSHTLVSPCSVSVFLILWNSRHFPNSRRPCPNLHCRTLARNCCPVPWICVLGASKILLGTPFTSMEPTL